MTGRKIIFEVYPLSFYEFLLFSEKNFLLGLLKGKNPFEGEFIIAEDFKRQLRDEYEKYIVYGGYPRVVLENDTEKKKLLLNEIYTAYIRKDVEAFFRVDDIEKFNNLIKYIAINSGHIFNKNNASKELGIAVKTINRYLNILSLSYITGIVKPFYKNKTKEILKMPKIYFFDNGIRNIIINNFNDIDSRVDAGVCMETAAYSYLVNKFKKREQIKFWRTKAGNEIDFIVESEKLYAIECKKSIVNFSKEKINAFIKNYKPDKFFVFNMDKEEKGEITYLPLWKLV